MGRLSRKSASGRPLLALCYDRNANRVKQTDVTGKETEYRFDPLDLLSEVYDNGEKLAGYDYTPGGQLQSLAHGPVETYYGYDQDKNLTALKVLASGEVLADNPYAYDGNGNRTRKRQMEGETRFSYDALNQVTRIEYPTLTEELFYDRAGNRTRRLAGGVEETYTYDPRNRLTSHTKGGVVTPYVYDNAGNLLRDGKAAYGYDAFNCTVKVDTFDGNVQINRYDAEGLRYELEENGRLVQFIFRQQEVITEQSETETIRLIRGYDLIASDAQSARTYYHYASDELGSTTHIVDKDGAIQNQYAYDAFGNVTEQKEAVPNRFKYNGQQLDPVTGQYYLRARFYNPVVARFTQEDLYRGDGLNLYAYCHNNPVAYVDPSGYNACSMDAQLAQQRAAASLTDTQFNEYRNLRSKGYTVAEALYLASGKNPLNAAGSEAMGRYEAQKLMAEYQRLTTQEYNANVTNPATNGHTLKPGQTVSGSTYGPTQQAKNETAITGGRGGYTFTHQTVNP